MQIQDCRENVYSIYWIFIVLSKNLLNRKLGLNELMKLLKLRKIISETSVQA